MPPTSYFPNTLPSHGQPLDSRDAETLGLAAAERVRKVLSLRANHSPTPLHALPGLAGELGVASLHVKDEGFRLGLGSFKALGGAYALMILVREDASRRLGRGGGRRGAHVGRGAGGRRDHDLRLRHRRKSRPLRRAIRASPLRRFTGVAPPPVLADRLAEGGPRSRDYVPLAVDHVDVTKVSDDASAAGTLEPRFPHASTSTLRRVARHRTRKNGDAPSMSCSRVSTIGGW